MATRAETVASLALTRAAGYVDETEPPVPYPTVSVKFGVRADGSTVMYEILNDPLGIYSDTFGNEYNPIQFAGTIPSKLSAKLLSQHVLHAARSNPQDQLTDTGDKPQAASEGSKPGAHAPPTGASSWS